MNNKIVDFLTSYGPQPAANNLYDEFVLSASNQYDCDPLDIEQPLIDRIVGIFHSARPVSVILTGTAGDGKTYTARKVAETLRDSSYTWQNNDEIFKLKIKKPHNRTVHFIKDLSEFNEEQKDNIFSDIRDALMGINNKLYVICVNDGHLLKFFRDREQGGMELKELITEMLQHDCTDDPNGNFQLFNMSRQSHHKIFDKIVDAIVFHKKWSDCENCPIFNSTSNPCPIRTNLEILRNNSDSSMRARLNDLIRIASADGKHLSIRQLILLLVNILLGDLDPSNRLLSCESARERAKKNQYNFTNPFANVFGDNLKEREKKQYGAFEVIGRFGIGKESNNFFDNSLISDDSNLPQDDIYGIHIFKNVRDNYLVNNIDDSTKFQKELINQRRRLFFSLNPKNSYENLKHPANPWNLTLFKYGETYIQIDDCLSEEGKKLPGSISSQIICGLNRIMTGEMTITFDRIWLTQPTGVFRGREKSLLVEVVGPQTHTTTHAKFLKSNSKGNVPILKIIPNNNDELGISLNLRPTLLECLLRIEDGELPSNFSSECSQDIYRFQLISSAAIRKASSQSQQTLKLIELDGGRLQTQTIDLNRENW